MDIKNFVMVREFSVWTTLGWFDVMQMYRRTTIGPGWHVLNIVIFSGAITAVYSSLFRISVAGYAPYIITGLIAWQWTVGVLAEGGKIYITQGYHVKDPHLKNEILPYGMAYKFWLIFLHKYVLVLFLVLVGVIEFRPGLLLIIPFSIFFFLLSVPMINLLGFLYVRYRDVEKLVGASTVIILMLTPVFWRPEMLQGWRSAFVLYNPFHHMIEFLRQPMTGHLPSLLNIAVVVGVGAVLAIVNYFVSKRLNSRIIFWI